MPPTICYWFRLAPVGIILALQVVFVHSAIASTARTQSCGRAAAGTDRYTALRTNQVPEISATIASAVADSKWAHVVRLTRLLTVRDSQLRLLVRRAVIQLLAIRSTLTIYQALVLLRLLEIAHNNDDHDQCGQLIALAESPDARIRSATIQAMSRIGASRFREILVRELFGTDARVAIMAAQVLVGSGTRLAALVLLRHALSPDFMLRGAVVEALQPIKSSDALALAILHVMSKRESDKDLREVLVESVAATDMANRFESDILALLSAGDKADDPRFRRLSGQCREVLKQSDLFKRPGAAQRNGRPTSR